MTSVKKTYQTLISIQELAAHLDDPEWAVVDCRFVLADGERGEQNYLEGHIPGAVYSHLNRDLSGKIIPGITGRHPLPSVDQTVRIFTKMGIGPGVQVVAYDEAGGAMAAGRLWWMLRWLGHEAAAVLDGGWQKWASEGREIRMGAETRPRREFTPQVRAEMLASAEEVERRRLDPAYRLVDARSTERFHGQNETLDPVGGHIPGATNAPYQENLGADGTFRPVKELRAYYKKLLGNVPAEKAIFYCGSGVTSMENLLAIQHAGLGEARLYAGSWSEWITDHKRPVEK